ncbi:MAG TPA: type II secretion system F family protein [Tepidisphaeraceae bacterium]|jgi:type IV pilus assembly protein PilC|nr:type II secretion system F family protein [Tepidisphaeraceae bacterium]
MANFAYTARDGSGQSISGTLTADSISEVSLRLRNEGKYPISVHPVADDAEEGEVQPISGLKISRNDVIQFSTQLAIMVETGVTIVEALDCIAAQCVKPRVKQLIEDLSMQVQGGSDFSMALTRHPRSFPRLYIALIKAAEKSGMLSKLLNRATAYLRDEQETLRRVKGALTYPGIMLAFAVSTTTFLLAFVLPKFTVIYASKGAALPLPTRILMAMSDTLVHNWMAVVTGVATAAVLGAFYFRSEGGARLWHFVQLRIPLMGAMYRKLHLSRGMRMIGTMAGAGVNLVDCVETAKDLSGNSYYRDLWQDVSDKIQTGKQLSEPLFANNLVPRSVAQMLHSGEKSGKLAFVMEQVSGYAEQELKEKIAELTRYIEPAMIVVMGFIIGGVALALMLPIFTISKVVAH